MKSGPFFLVGNERSKARIKRFLRANGFAAGAQLPGDKERYSAVYQWGEIEDGQKLRTLRHLIAANGTPDATDTTNRWNWYNAQVELERLNDVRLTERRLAVHGLRPALSIKKAASVPVPGLYRLFVSHLEVLTMYRGIAPVEIDSSIRLHRQIGREAIRVVYALGLEFAEVSIAARSGRFAVVAVDPAPRLSEETERLWAAQIRAALSGSDDVSPIRAGGSGREEGARIDAEERGNGDAGVVSLVTGSDCELLLCRDNGRVVFADRFFPRRGRIGCDGWRDRRRGMIFPLAELRPRPQRDAIALVKEIRRTMHEAVRRVDDDHIEWLAGGMPKPGFALGGHLHFSGVLLSTRLLRALDNYLALPLVMIEREEDGARRPRYGFLGDFRRKAHGGFEYRALSSWLVTPRIALAVCTLAMFIASYHRLLRQNPLSAWPLQKAYYAGDKRQLRGTVASLWEELCALEPFQPHVQSVKPLIERALTLRLWPSGEDVRKYWKVGPYVREK